jgi:hypothetical protein
VVGGAKRPSQQRTRIAQDLDSAQTRSTDRGRERDRRVVAYQRVAVSSFLARTLLDAEEGLLPSCAYSFLHPDRSSTLLLSCSRLSGPPSAAAAPKGGRRGTPRRAAVFVPIASCRARAWAGGNAKTHRVTGRTISGALATSCSRVSPGGLHREALTHGDVVLSESIGYYEHGKIDDGRYNPRERDTFRVDQGLLTQGQAFARTTTEWKDCDVLPYVPAHQPKMVPGLIGSGEEVVDDLKPAPASRPRIPNPFPAAHLPWWVRSRTGLRDANVTTSTVLFRTRRQAPR